MRASDLLGPHGPLARAIPGYEHRPSQMQMADAVEEALDRDDVLLVEAGTGTGKTWAYLIPAILSGRRVVISTGTRALQDQIMNRDLPALEAHLGLEVRAVCMKGLQNYLCLRRLELFRGSPEAMRPDTSRQLRVIEEWRGWTESGDRADLPLPEDASAWPHVQSGPDTRVGARCVHFDACFVTKMRRAAERAQILVVNHHLFFADLALRGDGSAGGSVLPRYDGVIFDEAHQLDEVATLFFGASVSSGQVDRLAQDATRALVAAKDPSPLPESLRAAAAAFFIALPAPREGQDRVPLERAHFDATLEARYFALDDALEALGAHAARRIMEAHDDSLAQVAKRCGAMRDDLARITEAAAGQSVAWLSRRGAGLAIGVSPIDVSRILRRELFAHGGLGALSSARAVAVVLTSATLTTGGSFDYLARKLGLQAEPEEDVDELDDFGSSVDSVGAGTASAGTASAGTASDSAIAIADSAIADSAIADSVGAGTASAGTASAATASAATASAATASAATASAATASAATASAATASTDTASADPVSTDPASADETSEPPGPRPAPDQASVAAISRPGDPSRLERARVVHASVVHASANPASVVHASTDSASPHQASVVRASTNSASTNQASTTATRFDHASIYRTLALASPFDYPSQAGLYVPERMPEPRDPRFIEAATAEILGLVAITDGGAFVLCTSFRHMHALAQACRPTLVDRGYPVLVQGERPKAATLDRFREARDAVLFATASFWEGVDVPGRALRLVVIDKLPFEVPTDPLVRARCERLEARGGKPFMELLVPAAALSLKQGFGRLIRSREDRGIVAILDARLVKKGYGRVFLRSLPDASRLYSLAEAKSFWEEGS